MKKEEKPFAFRGKYLFLTVLIIYMVLFLAGNEKVIPAIQKSGTIMMRIVPILVVVILLTALLNYFLRPKQIVKHLGHESGAKAWLWALAAGVVSHGPMYAWYSLIEDLRSHGMRDGLIVVFFASRTIKLPLLPMMVDYFGWIFTVVVSLYLLIGALIQGLFLEMLDNR